MFVVVEDGLVPLLTSASGLPPTAPLTAPDLPLRGRLFWWTIWHHASPLGHWMPVNPPLSTQARFSVRGLACRRGDRLVFRGIDFALGDGAALILRGPNGSGKSSLLRVLAGLTPAFGGTLRWEGQDIAEDWLAHRARLHFIGHLDALKPVLTPIEMLGFWSRLRGGSLAAAGRALERFHLADLAQLPCRFLSAGQRRRLSLARLLTSQAALWLLDEPTVGLDEASTADILDAIAEHRAGGSIVIASTHMQLAIEGAQTLALDEFAPG